MNFELNGVKWNVVYVAPQNSVLRRSDGSLSVGVTDKSTRCIYLSERLTGGFLRKVLIHEICHAVCMSFDIYLPLEQEEVLCDFVATYGDKIFDLVDKMIVLVNVSAA